MNILIFLAIILQCHCVLSANILYLSVLCSKSHYIWNKIFAKALEAEGHNLTMVGPDANNEPDTDHFHSIVLEGVYPKIQSRFQMNKMKDLGLLQQLNLLNQWCEWQCRYHYETKGLQQILNYPDNFKFDLVIYDISVGPCLFLLIEKFNYPPIIAVTPFLLSGYVAHHFGNHLYPLYVPWYSALHTNKMSFFERLNNIIFTYLDVYLKNVVEFVKEEQIALETFGINKRPWSDIYRNITLLLANIDPFISYPQPLPPNIIPVGGLHALPPQKLPQDLEKFLDSSTNGVIVMSLGTNVRSDHLGDKVIREILKAFARMPENVLWKFESDIQDVPSNVFIRKWLPQNDVLNHRNVKLFIGHGGALSTQETICHGVPILAIPFVLDQRSNAQMVKEKGIGDELDVELISEEYFYHKIRNILDNSEYKNNVKALSDGFKRQLQTPLERAVFWVDYVLKYGNPTILNTPLRDMPWYQTMYLDIILFVVSVFGLIVFVIYRMINKIIKKFGKKLKSN